MVWGDEYMIKLFASDLDGTLLNELHESDEVIFNSIQQVLNKNLYFTIATGRDLNFFVWCSDKCSIHTDLIYWI